MCTNESAGGDLASQVLGRLAVRPKDERGPRMSRANQPKGDSSKAGPSKAGPLKAAQGPLAGSLEALGPPGEPTYSMRRAADYLAQGHAAAQIARWLGVKEWEVIAWGHLVTEHQRNDQARNNQGEPLQLGSARRVFTPPARPVECAATPGENGVDKPQTTTKKGTSSLAPKSRTFDDKTRSGTLAHFSTAHGARDLAQIVHYHMAGVAVRHIRGKMSKFHGLTIRSQAISYGLDLWREGVVKVPAGARAARFVAPALARDPEGSA